MNFCLQNYTIYQFTYFIYYLFQDKLKDPKNYENPTSTSKVTRKTIFTILFKWFSICNSFEFKATQIYWSSMTDLVMCQCESYENVKELLMMSPHVMPHPIVSQIANVNCKCRCEPQRKP